MQLCVKVGNFLIFNVFCLIVSSNSASNPAAAITKPFDEPLQGNLLFMRWPIEE